jgi:prepilin-type N-terminal cleavage/methylation domain-containing protein
VRRRGAGFTLTEMMVVVTIIGILVTMAIVYMRPRVRPIDVANRVGDLVREASRRAVALGQVRADVALHLGSKARTQITAAAMSRSVAGSSPAITFTTVTFTLWRLQEDALPANTGQWIAIEQYVTDPNVDVESWAPGVVNHMSAGRTSDWSRWVFPTAADPPPIPPLQCRPDGTCDACSIFFKYVLPGPSCDPLTPPGVPIYDRCGKLAAMPLGGAITTRTDWN